MAATRVVHVRIVKRKHTQNIKAQVKRQPFPRHGKAPKSWIPPVEPDLIAEADELAEIEEWLDDDRPSLSEQMGRKWDELRETLDQLDRLTGLFAEEERERRILAEQQRYGG